MQTPSDKPKKCLVTGGAGFIGSHLCERLLRAGFEVVSLDNLITGSEENIRHLKKNSGFYFVQKDVLEPITNFQLPITNFDFIFHLASIASPPKYQKYSIETLLTNSLGTYNLLELAKKSRSVFILASTSEIYGDPEVHPQPESYFGNVNSVGPRACYDEAKRFSEAITMEYFRKFNLDTRIIRIFNTYGPRMEKDDGRVVSNFVNQAIGNQALTVYGSGNQTRSFCYVSDMIEGFMKVTEKGKMGEIYNLGNPDERSVKEIGELILKLTGSSSKFNFLDKVTDDPGRRKPDIKKAYEQLSWSPKVDLEEGLLKTIKYFREIGQI
ncbi:MAG: UDP-glucuronate decarboxylase [Candidatus Gottesmanbacteria bacterium GW2011_GWC2_39_8]|uniref:UDP-glucuronate decarboxylase n=1 Tax=Candidatus Gottesmanbacteria bacterium GW2011_GWC2_39_8 TaxID=1618450 RepID=A0A0G0SI04_9BACT|nr:MAG: UDP-glucuronate decarboxylase [Candidatus Gottesmanbacteria bacterium GW2011_GWC2_39_8]